MPDPQVLRAAAVVAFLGAVLVAIREVLATPGPSSSALIPAERTPPAGAPTARGERILAGLAPFETEIQNAAATWGLDPDLLRALVWRESSGNPYALGDLTARGGPSYGLGQVLLATARGMGFTGAPEDLFDPAVNLYYTARYLRERLDIWGDVSLAVSAYNAGTARFVGDRLANEPYVNDVLNNLAALG